MMCVMRSRGMAVALVLITGSGCAGTPPAQLQPQPQPSASVVVPRSPPPPTARERIDTALARRAYLQASPLARVELTAAPISELPLPRNPPQPSAIKIHDDYWPTRLLEHAGTESNRWFENERVASRLGVECFSSVGAAGAAVVISDVILATPQASATTISNSGGSPALARCIEEQLVKQAGTPFLSVVVRVTTRFVLDASASSEVPMGIDEDLAELDARMAKSGETKELTLMLGSRHLIAAQYQASRKAQHLVVARAAFDRALTVAGGDAAARAAALDGIAAVLTLQDKPEDAVVPSRALACPARFSFPAAPATTTATIDQDHPEAYWKAWEQLHPFAIAKTPANKRAAITTPPPPGGPRAWEEETKYRSPYEGCQGSASSPQQVSEVSAPNAVSNAWRRIGAYHATSDKAAGPFRINRAVTALRVALASAQPGTMTRSFAAFDLGRTLLLQQRYREAARVLAALLASKDPRDEQLTMRAAQLLATSLTHFDFDGAPESEPASGLWPDIAETEVNPTVVARKMKAVVDRIDDPELALAKDPVAQALVLRWMPWELLSGGFYDTASTAARKFLDRFPLHRDAPAVQWEEVVALQALANMHKPQTPQAIAGAKLEAEARTRMSQQYVGNTSWAQANKADADALKQAAELAQRKK